MRQHDHAIRAGRIIVRPQEPAASGTDAKNLEVIGRHHVPEHQSRAIA
jgi:hypothetical protein